MENNKIKISLMITALIITALALIFSAGCVNQETEYPEITNAEITDELYTAIHDIYRDSNYLDISISEDIHILTEKIYKAKDDSEIQKIVLEYYSANPWISNIIRYDAATDTTMTVPVQMSKDALEALTPTNKQLINAKDNYITINSVFVDGYGYLNVYLKSLYDDNDKYLGYIMILADFYLQLNYNPIVLSNDKSYKDYAVFIVDENGYINFATKEESIGTKITDSEPYYNGVSLVVNQNGEFGAYTYTSKSKYSYNSDLMTEKIAAWIEFNKGTYKYKIYVIEDLDASPIDTENVYEPHIPELIEDVNDLFVYARTNGVDEAKKYLKTIDTECKIHIIDMKGNVLSSTEDEYIGLNILNKRGAFSYPYVSGAIYTAQQGGGYIYYTNNVEGTIEPNAYQYAIGYVIPISSECFIFGRTAGNPDAIINDKSIRSDLTTFTRKLIEYSNQNGVDKLINVVNDPDNEYLVESITGINADYVLVLDNEGKLYAADKINSEYIGQYITSYIDVYGGSVVRKGIIAAEEGGGYISVLYKNTEKEGYVDLWVFSVEPLDDGYIVAAGKYITTFEDLLTPYLD